MWGRFGRSFIPSTRMYKALQTEHGVSGTEIKKKSLLWDVHGLGGQDRHGTIIISNMSWQHMWLALCCYPLMGSSHLILIEILWRNSSILSLYIWDWGTDRLNKWPRVTTQLVSYRSDLNASSLIPESVLLTAASHIVTACCVKCHLNRVQQKWNLDGPWKVSGSFWGQKGEGRAL